MYHHLVSLFPVHKMLAMTFKLASKSQNVSVYLIYNDSLRGGKMVYNTIAGQLFSEHNIELGS